MMITSMVFHGILSLYLLFYVLLVPYFVFMCICVYPEGGLHIDALGVGGGVKSNIKMSMCMCVEQ